MKIGTLPATNWVCSIWQTESQTWSDHPRHGIPYSPPATVLAQSWPGTVAMHVISVGLEEASPFFVSRAAEECHQSLDDAEVLSLAAAALQKHLAGADSRLTDVEHQSVRLCIAWCGARLAGN